MHTTDLPFKYYILTSQTVIDNYLVLPKYSYNLTNSGIPAPLTDRSGLSRVGIELQDVSCCLDDTLCNRDHYLLSQLLLPKRELNNSAPPSPQRYFFFIYAITERGLPLLLSACLPKSTDILTECTVTTNVSNALNLKFDWETFSKTLHITSPYSWSFLLKLIPTGLSFWLTRFLNRYPHHIGIIYVT